ncbi:MAG: hypothetical protein IJZ22_01025 [Bacteroidaceae bacterium]|nr:hypothetical protein [Bacteroidaceae bacterium]
MNGIEIIYNNKRTLIGVKNGQTIVHINSINSNNENGAILYSASIDYDNKVRHIWHKYNKIKKGDILKIRLVNIKEITTPIESVYDNNITPLPSKLEIFYALEASLKSKGLL